LDLSKNQNRQFSNSEILKKSGIGGSLKIQIMTQHWFTHAKRKLKKTTDSRVADCHDVDESGVA
jgi:hypothetical protein